MKKLKIDWDELETAFTMDQYSEMDHYLDTQTGDILMVTGEDVRAVEEFFDSSLPEDADIDAEFENWLQEDSGCVDWQEEGMRSAYRVEQDSERRYLFIPKQESRDGYDDMVDFAERVDDNRLRELLSIALNGKGAFRRFKDVLISYPDDRERWFKFSEDRLKERMLRWLEDEEVEAELFRKHAPQD